MINIIAPIWEWVMENRFELEKIIFCLKGRYIK